MKNNLFKLVSITIIFLSGCNPKNRLGLNENASINNFGYLPENPLLLNTISTSFHLKDSLITVLYGNKFAYNYAKICGDGNYPPSAVLYNISWQMQNDEQWFGANVPKNIRNIERIEFLEKNKTIYNHFDSNGIEHTNSDNMQKRINHIKEIKMAVSP